MKCSLFHYEEQTLAKIVRLEHRLQLLEARTEKTESRQIAFSAGLSTTTSSLSPEQVIVFDKMLLSADNTNAPCTYNKATGVFTAPVRGVYFFSITILGGQGVTGHFIFYKNNERLSTLFIDGGISRNTWDSAAQSILLLLDHGDNVSVRNCESGSVVEGQFRNTVQSIFSGFLLFER